MEMTCSCWSKPWSSHRNARKSHSPRFKAGDQKIGLQPSAYRTWREDNLDREAHSSTQLWDSPQVSLTQLHINCAWSPSQCPWRAVHPADEPPAPSRTDRLGVEKLAPPTGQSVALSWEAPEAVEVFTPNNLLLPRPRGPFERGLYQDQQSPFHGSSRKTTSVSHQCNCCSTEHLFLVVFLTCESVWIKQFSYFHLQMMLKVVLVIYLG